MSVKVSTYFYSIMIQIIISKNKEYELTYIKSRNNMKNKKENRLKPLKKITFYQICLETSSMIKN